jgi:putative ABC transport system permease protein
MAVWQDLRFAARTLRRNPGFTAAAVATLALGIGINTAMFSTVNSVLLRPLPYRDADRLVLLWTADSHAGLNERETGYANVLDWQRQARSFEDLGYMRSEPLIWVGEPEPESLETDFVSPNCFAELGAHPVAGRTFTADEALRGEPLAVISYELWQRRMGGSPGVIGRTASIGGKSVQVIGVLPPGFRPLHKGTSVWMPYTFAPYFREEANSRSVKFGWEVIGKLRQGVGLEEARSEMTGIVARLAQTYQDDRGMGVRLVPLLDQVVGPVRLGLTLLLAAVAMVLLIACANLGNLVLARGAGRTREIELRAALGAGRGRLLSQLFTESLVLAGTAGTLGLLLADAAVRAIVAFAPRDTPRLHEISLDSRAVLFTLVLCLLSAVLFGLAPAFRLASTASALGVRGSGTRHARRTRDLLVVVECGVAIVLLAGAGLMLRSMSAILRLDPGFHGAGVLTMKFDSRVSDDPARFQQLVSRLESLPGVEAAGGISRYFQVNAMHTAISIDGQPPLDPASAPMINFDVIGGRYLQAIGLPLLRGRYFSAADSAEAPKVAVVNQAFADLYLPHIDPVGHVLRRDFDRTAYTIVGVVGNTRRQSITSEPIPEVLWPQTQRPWGMALAVRTQADPLALVPAVRHAIRDLDSGAVIQTVSTLDRQLDDRLAQRRFQTWLVGLFAALALALAAAGIYSVMYYAVAERTCEIGIRVAIGAAPRDVFRLILGDAGRLVLIGIGIGVAGALWLTRTLAALLYGVTAHDPATYAGVAILLGAIAVVAAAAPAAKAMRSDPLAALRQE